MAEVVGTLSAAAQLAQLTANLLKYAYEFQRGATHYDKRLKDLCGELEALHSVIGTVQVCLNTPMLLETLNTLPEHVQQLLLGNLVNNLNNCSRSVEDFGDLFADFNPTEKLTWRHRGHKALELKWRSEEFEEVRQKLRTYQSAVHIWISTMQLRNQMRSQARDADEFQRLHAEVQQLSADLKTYAVQRRELEDTQTRNKTVSDESTKMLQDFDDVHALSESTRKAAAKELRRRSILYGLEPVVPFTDNDSDREGDVVSLPGDPYFSGSQPGRATPPASGPMASSARQPTPDKNKSFPDVKQTQTPDGSVTSESFERILADILTCSRLNTKPAKPLGDEEFDRITGLLHGVGKPTWAERPRTYLVLRLIDQVKLMDDFVLNGMKDINFPYTPTMLPSFMHSHSVRDSFLHQQVLVLSPKSADLVKGGKHRHIGGTHGADSSFFVTGTLGKGAQGIVDIVRHKMAWQEYARKRFPRSKTFAKDKRALATFENEVHNLKRLEHLHLVRFIGSYTDFKYVGIIMDPVADCDLRRFLEDTAQSDFPAPRLDTLRSFLGCLCAAVQYLHSQKCRHKDIKPANILVKNDKVLITDFGIAIDSSELDRDTTIGPSAFTSSYAAPESVDRLGARNFSADIFSLGCVFLDIMTTLKRQTLNDREEFFMGTGSTSKYIWENLDALSKWIEDLEGISEESNEPLSWIRHMTVLDRNQRPDANTLLSSIQSASSLSNTYCGPCCDGKDDTSSTTDDDSWQPSQSDDEAEGPDHSPSMGEQGSSSEFTSFPTERQAYTTDPTTVSRSRSPQAKDLKSKQASFVLATSPTGRMKIPRFSWQDPTETSTRNSRIPNQRGNFPTSADQAMSEISEENTGSRALSSSARFDEPASPSASRNISSPSQAGDTQDGALSTPALAAENDGSKIGMSTLKISNEQHIKPSIDTAPPSDSPPLSFPNNVLCATSDLDDRFRDNETIPSSSDSEQSFHVSSEGDINATHAQISLCLETNASEKLQELIQTSLQRGKSFLLKCFKSMDLDQRFWRDNTLLHEVAAFPASKLSLKTARLLVKAGASVNMGNLFGNTPLHHAVSISTEPSTQREQIALVKLLLLHKANPAARNVRQQTPLHIAAEQSSSSVVSLLISALAGNLNTLDDRGDTALVVAARASRVNVSSAISSAGADRSALGSEGLDCTPVSEPADTEELKAVLVMHEDPEFTAKECSDSRKDANIHSENSIASSRCKCEACCLSTAVEPLHDHDGKKILHCICTFHLERLTQQMRGSVQLLKNGTETCNCTTCAESKNKAAAIFVPRTGCLCERCRSARKRVSADEQKRVCELLDQEVDSALQDFRTLEAHSTNDDSALKDMPFAADFHQQSFVLPRNNASAWHWILQNIDAKAEYTDKDVAVIVKLVLRKAPPSLIETRDDLGRTLLHRAAGTGKIAVVDLLIDSKAALETKTNARFADLELTPLAYSLAYGHAAVARLLLRRGADAHTRVAGDPLLHFLFLRDKPDKKLDIKRLLLLLLALDPDLKLENKGGLNALQVACQRRNIEAMRLLIDSGVEVNPTEQSSWNSSPLSIAIQQNDVEAVQFLIDRGAALTGRNAFLHAAAYGSGAVIAALLTIRETLERAGYTKPVHSDHDNMHESHDADQRRQALLRLPAHDTEGRSPLHKIAAARNSELKSCLSQLLTLENDIDACDEKGGTALHHAAFYGSPYMVRSLLNRNANVTMRDKEGKTALDLAQDQRHHEVVELLGGEVKRNWWKP